MQNTKDRILREALRLFARQGYEAVSMRDIAGRLGLTQSALYKHYSGKRDIFESIVRHMEEQDAERARLYGMPEERYSQAREAYSAMRLDILRDFTMAQFMYWAEDDFAADYRRMLTLEQYRTPEMTALYQQYLSGGIIEYLADIFREIPQTAGAPELLALEFFAPIYMLLNLCDAAQDKSATVALAREHIERFIGNLG